MGCPFIETPSKKNEKFIIGLDDHLGEKPMGHIDETFKMVIEKSLMSEILYPHLRTIVPKEEPKP